MLKVKNLRKKFNDKIILDNISFQFNENEIIGLVGPNGVGKTTLLNCLVGNQSFDSGEIIYFHNYHENSQFIRNKVFFLQDVDKLNLHITGKEYIGFIGSLYGIKKLEFTPKAIKLCKLFLIDQNLDEYISTYSHGMTKKLMFITALLCNTPILFLDEPFNGLDPDYLILTNKIIQLLQSIGKTVIVSSHNLTYIKEISTQLIFMLNQKIYYSGSSSEFFNSWNNSTFDEIWTNVTTNSNVNTENLLELLTD